MLRGSLAAVLQSEGYKVESAANALDALRRLERRAQAVADPARHHASLHGRPRVSRRCSGPTPDMADIPVIVITAVGVRPDIAAELDLRQSFFKPLERPRLLDAIRRHCTPSARADAPAV